MPAGCPREERVDAMPNAQAPSRRSFLASTAVAAVAVAGGVPLLGACSGSSGGDRTEGATTGKKLQDILPTFVGSDVVQPDVPSRNGSALGFTTALPASRLAVSVPKKLGKGSTVTVMAPLWGTPPKSNNPYWTAMDEAIGVKVNWQNQDGNTYGQKLGAVLASSSVPDAVVVPAWELGGKIPSAINNKFADLGPYLSGDKVKEYPNLARSPPAPGGGRSSAASCAVCPCRPATSPTSRRTTGSTSSRRRATRRPPPRRSSSTSPRRSPRPGTRSGAAAT
jgi:putative aldouronate transport system substrate-binding protein